MSNSIEQIRDEIETRKETESERIRVEDRKPVLCKD
jgi:hypothetical protein